MAEITLGIAALAGLGSFAAPCILPMIPAFLAYISGTTISELNQNDGSKTISINRSSIILNSIFFVLGFSVVFSTFGVIINSVLSTSSGEFIERFNQVGGIIIIGFGIFLLLSTKISKLNMEKKFFPKRSKASYPMSFVFGLAFAAGWTPVSIKYLGSDLSSSSKLSVSEPNLYNIISIDESSTRELEIRVVGKGFQIFTCTFG